MLNVLNKKLRQNLNYNKILKLKLFRVFRNFTNKQSNEAIKSEGISDSNSIEEHLEHEHEIKINCNNR